MGRRTKHHHHHHHHGPPPPIGPADILVGRLAFIGGCILLGYFTFVSIKQWFLFEFFPSISEKIDVSFLTLPQPYRFTLDFYTYTIGLPFKAAGYIWTRLFTEGLTGFLLIDLLVALIAIIFSFFFFAVLLKVIEIWIQAKYRNFNLRSLATFMFMPFAFCLVWGFFHMVYVIIM